MKNYNISISDFENNKGVRGLNTKVLSLKNITGFLLIIAVVALAIYSIDILILLFASFVVTCAITPLINKLEQYIPRIWAVTVVLLALILTSVLILIPLITIIVKEAAGLIDTFPVLLDNIDSLLDIKMFDHSLAEFITLDSLKDTFIQNLKGLVENSIIAGKWVANFLTSILAISIMVFYLAYDEKRIKDKFIEFFPPKDKKTAGRILDNISSKVGNYVFAQGIAMVFVGLITAIGLLILNNPHALLLGFITCIFDIIPVIGPSVAIGIGLITSITGGFVYVLLTFFVYILAQFAQNQFLRPIVFGKLMNMHPLMIIVALLLCSRIFGFWGIILAPAIASVVCVLVDELYLNRINHR